MRHVLRNHHEVAHFWAHARQSEGRACNVFFEGDTIYSYGKHFPIARRLSFGVYAMTTKSYSISTSKHIGIVRNAIPRDAKVLFVADPTMTASLSDRRYCERGVEAALVRSQRPRIHQSTRDSERAHALRTAGRFNEYAEAVGSSERIDLSPFSDIDKLRADIAERERIAAAAAAEAQRKAGLELAEKVEAWRNHAGGVRYVDIYRAPVALRISTDVTRDTDFPNHGVVDVIETSHGASIPIEAARRLWPVIQRIKNADSHAVERDYEVGMELGGYRLTRIRTDGSIVVGCHDIAYSEIERIAQQLGLITTTEESQCA